MGNKTCSSSSGSKRENLLFLPNCRWLVRKRVCRYGFYCITLFDGGTGSKQSASYYSCKILTDSSLKRDVVILTFNSKEGMYIIHSVLVQKNVIPDSLFTY